jgi:hypothetical protein
MSFSISVGSKLLNLRADPINVATLVVQITVRIVLALQKGIPSVILALLLLQMACAANGNISWRRFLEYEVSDKYVNSSSFALSFNCQEAFFYIVLILFYELQMRDILK